MSHFEAILFDMDGVLVDVSTSYRRVIEETATHFMGQPVESGTVQRYKNLGGYNDDWALTHAIIQAQGVNVPLSRVIAEFQRRYRGDQWNGLITSEKPIISMRCLQLLKKQYRVMGVVTGRPEAEARWTIAHFGWQSFFPLIVAKEQQDTRPKPDPYPLTRALGTLRAAQLSIRPDQAVYIGDTVDDMKAARAAGLWALGFAPSYLDDVTAHTQLLRDHGAHETLTDMRKLPEVLQHWSFGAEDEQDPETATP